MSHKFEVFQRETEYFYWVALELEIGNAGNLRVSSPRETSSTLMTSAPRSASNIVAVGPARTRVKSRIRTPLSGGGIPGPYGIAGVGAGDEESLSYDRVCTLPMEDKWDGQRCQK